MEGEWNDKIFAVNDSQFEALALSVFQFQYQHNPVYRLYVDELNVDPGSIQSIRQIPFLPVGFFKTHEVKTTAFQPQAIFESSGTSGSNVSRHFINDVSWYERSFLSTFNLFYGNVKDYCIIGLLPSYAERKNSSLVYMTEKLIQWSGHKYSGIYLDEFAKLEHVLKELEQEHQKTWLIGVSFALLDLAEQLFDRRDMLVLNRTIVVETGGMKGRKEEMIRSELHDRIKKTFPVGSIHSEYGMTELLSQAYSAGEGFFRSPPWMKVLARDEEDPLGVRIPERERDAIGGAINIIDLANIYSCSFIATDDVGRFYPDGRFEVLGRMDGSDLRGCSLMVAAGF